MPWGAIVGGLIGAAGSIIGGNKAADAAEDAAGVQWNMYTQNRQDLAPYREVGNSALNAYARAMGLPGYGEGGARTTDPANAVQYPTSGKVNQYTVVKAFQEFLGRKPTKRELKYYSKRERGDQLYYDVVRPGVAKLEQAQAANAPAASAPAQADSDPYGGFMESPGYQFRYDEGQRGVDRNMAARGRYLSGAREKAAIRYGQNYASNEFGNYMNRLAGAANIGQTATNTGVSAGQAAAGNVGNAMINAGNARASGYMGVANSLVNGINNWQASRAYG